MCFAQHSAVLEGKYFGCIVFKSKSICLGKTRKTTEKYQTVSLKQSIFSIPSLFVCPLGKLSSPNKNQNASRLQIIIRQTSEQISGSIKWPDNNVRLGHYPRKEGSYLEAGSNMQPLLDCQSNKYARIFLKSSHDVKLRQCPGKGRKK